MDQLMCASLSHIRFWYEVGMFKVPAENNALVLSIRKGNGNGTYNSKKATSSKKQKRNKTKLDIDHI